MVTETIEETAVEEKIEVETPQEEFPAETPVVEEPAKEEVPISFTNQGELDKHIAQKASSIADKSTATYQQKISELHKELKAAKDKQEDDALAKLGEAQTQEWSGEQNVGDYQEAVRDLVKRSRVLRDKEEEWDTNHELATESARNVNAFTEALNLLLPEDNAGFVTTLTELANKIAGAETDREKALIVQLEKARLKAEAEAPKPKRTKPDPNIVSVPGGADLSKLSARELIARGIPKIKSE